MVTKEQQAVLDAVMHKDSHLIKIKAIAGSGKTHTLVEIAKQYTYTKGIYLAYNKAIATEASEKFKDTVVKCSTLHSLAYRATVRQYGLRVGWFNPRDVQADITYKDKKEVVRVLEEFLASSSLNAASFLAVMETDCVLTEAVLRHLDLMADGEIDSPHGFYLKMYHVLLMTKVIPAPETDLLMLDEFGDVAAVTLDIFMAIKAKKKIAVGDSYQNIYTFNNTINGFTALRDEGETLKLTNSFRVSDIIAERIQGFMRKNVESAFTFKGREYSADFKIASKGYIARTNSGLLHEMLVLQRARVAFKTTRNIELIIELPLLLSNLGNGRAIINNKYKAIEKLRKVWEVAYSKTDIPFLNKYNTAQAYVLDQMKDDDSVKGAFKVVNAFGEQALNSLVVYAKKCDSIDTKLTLTTAHSSKGLEFDMVEIAPDFNMAIDTARDKVSDARRKGFGVDEALENLKNEYLLYYVGCSRALVRLDNATHLPK